MNGKKAKKIRKKILAVMNENHIEFDTKKYRRMYQTAKKMYKAGAITLLLAIFTLSNVYADTLKVPFKCNPKQIQKYFLDKGYKLDLNGNEKTSDDVWGFIQNHGNCYEIVTYDSVTDKDLENILEITRTCNNG